MERFNEKAKRSQLDSLTAAVLKNKKLERQLEKCQQALKVSNEERDISRYSYLQLFLELEVRHFQFDKNLS